LIDLKHGDCLELDEGYFEIAKKRIQEVQEGMIPDE
jgi:hypothetical protein